MMSLHVILWLSGRPTKLTQRFCRYREAGRLNMWVARRGRLTSPAHQSSINRASEFAPWNLKA